MLRIKTQGPLNFSSCNEELVEKLKKLEHLNNENYKQIFRNLDINLERIGNNFSNGHLYGLPKLHIRPTDPLLRQNPSKSDTSSQEFAQ